MRSSLNQPSHCRRRLWRNATVRAVDTPLGLLGGVPSAHCRRILGTTGDARRRIGARVGAGAARAAVPVLLRGVAAESVGRRRSRLNGLAQPACPAHQLAVDQLGRLRGPRIQHEKPALASQVRAVRVLGDQVIASKLAHAQIAVERPAAARTFAPGGEGPYRPGTVPGGGASG
jgi:hypothetical protein